MARRSKQLTQITIYIFSAIVILSMVLGLVGPILFRTPRSPTPTPWPTWTPWPTLTPTATVAPTAAPPLPPSATPRSE